MIDRNYLEGDRVQHKDGRWGIVSSRPALFARNEPLAHFYRVTLVTGLRRIAVAQEWKPEDIVAHVRPTALGKLKAAAAPGKGCYKNVHEMCGALGAVGRKCARMAGHFGPHMARDAYMWDVEVGEVP